MAPSDGGKADPDRGCPATTGQRPAPVGSGAVEARAGPPSRARGPPSGQLPSGHASSAQRKKRHDRCRHIGRANATQSVSYRSGVTRDVTRAVSRCIPCMPISPHIPVVRMSRLILLSVAHGPVCPSWLRYRTDRRETWPALTASLRTSRPSRYLPC